MGSVEACDMDVTGPSSRARAWIGAAILSALSCGCSTPAALPTSGPPSGAATETEVTESGSTGAVEPEGPTGSVEPAAPEPSAPFAAPEVTSPPSPSEATTTVEPPYDPTAFALVCLFSRATGEGGNEWWLYGCPASPAALPPSARPSAIVRRLRSYTTQLRADLEYDGSGRLTAITHRFEGGRRARVVYTWGGDGELARISTDGADGALATRFRREGDRAIAEQTGVRRTRVPAATGHGLFEQVSEGSDGVHRMLWSLQFVDRSHVATRVEGDGYGYRRMELGFDAGGRPTEARSFLSPALGPDRVVFVWRGDRLVGVDAMTGEMDRVARVDDIIWR